MRSLCASSRSAPRAGSVVNTRCRDAACAERLLQPAAYHQVLRHRLGGTTGLADDIDQYPPWIDSIQRRRNGGWIDILQDGEPREEITPFIVPLIPARPALAR